MQTDLVHVVLTTLSTSSQLLDLLQRVASVLYPVDAHLSGEVRDRVARWRFTFGDTSCIEYTYGELPTEASLLQITHLLFRAYPRMRKEMRVIITRADQLLGRARFYELLREVKTAA